MTPRLRFLAPLCAIVLALAAARAQDVVPFGSPQQSALVARALREWTSAFEQGRLGARAVLQRGVERQPAYVAPARAAGYVTERDETNITHAEALQKLMQHAEREVLSLLSLFLSLPLSVRYLEYLEVPVRR